MVPYWRRGALFFLLPEGTDVHIHRKEDLNLCLALHFYGKVYVELKKITNKEFNYVYGA